MKKTIFLAFMLTIIAFFSLSCGAKKDTSDTIILWHWMTDRDNVLQELALKYEKLTGVKVKIDLYAPSDAYIQKIIACAQAKTLPDIYGNLNRKEIFASFIKNGYVADLTEEFKKDNGAWEKSLFEKALAVNSYGVDNIYGVNPGIYGVPIDVTNVQMLYNKDLLEKAGIKKIPETFDEFLQSIEALKRVGIPGFVSGWGELWMPECFAMNYAFNIMGEEKVMETFKGSISYTDPDWIKVLNIFKILGVKKAFIEGIVTKVNKYAEQDFALERAGFAFNGSWCVNVYDKMNPDLRYGTMFPPIINPNNSMKIWGGAGSSLVVNNSSSKKQQAIEFLKWLSDTQQQIYLSEKTKNLPANKNAVTSIPKILSDFAKDMDNTTHPTIWKYNEDSSVLDRFDKGIQAIIIGDKTPEDVAKEVQAKKEEVMKRKEQRRTQK